jgi:LuxR family transcriptional activator of conjugal transfer of Ti plasmids
VTSQDIIFQDFTDALWGAGDETALRAVAYGVASRLGFRWFAYLGIHATRTVWISNYPRTWISRYFDQSYEHIDPVVETARRERRAFSWQGTDRRLLPSSAHRRFFAEARDFEIAAGITIPIRGGRGQMNALTLATGDANVDVERQLHAQVEVIELIGLYYHARVDATSRTPLAQQIPQLTQREGQCLAWTARGKTMGEIASIIGISQRTVSFHLENARTKLDATNVAHAVAIALRRELIR